jgi:uncharacterized protein (TIGR03437 family)
MKISPSLLLLVGSIAQAQSYTYSSFGPPPGANYFNVVGVDSAGEVVVTYRDASQVTHSALRSADGSTYTPIQAPGATSTIAQGVSAAGLIVGYYLDADQHGHNFIVSGNGKTFATFDSPGIPVAINDQGEVLISVPGAFGSSGLLRSADGSIYSKITAGGTSTIIGGINNHNEIVGWSKVADSYSARHGFLRSADGKYQVVDLPGTLEGTFLVGINNHGQILVSNPSGFVLNPDGSSLSLDPVLGQWPAAINDTGIVVGMVYPAGTRGFLAVPTAATQPVIRSVMGVETAAAFGGLSTIAPGSWVEIYGVNLALGTRQWSTGDFVNGNTAPTSLDGVKVTINGRPAFVSYVSPGQVNAQAPSDLTPGLAVVTVTNGTQTSAPYMTTIEAVGPGLLSTAATEYSDNITIFLPDGSAAQTVRPGDTIILYGIGFGPTTPDVAAGQIASQPDRLQGLFEATFSTLGAVTSSGQVTYAGHAPGTVGLYQFNVVVPNQGSQPYRAVLRCLFNGHDLSSPFLTGPLNVVP